MKLKGKSFSMWEVYKNSLTSIVEDSFPIIKENFTPKLTPGYSGWRLDEQQEWDTSMYLPFSKSLFSKKNHDAKFTLEFEFYIKKILDEARKIGLDFVNKKNSNIRDMFESDIFITKYINSEGVKEHVDGTFLSILIGLNSDFNGGDLKILDKNGEHFIRYETGDIVIMDGKVKHMGTKVTSGERWIMAIFYQLV